MNFTDTHSHIAWGVDDGIQTEEEARKALEMAREDGITRILSTPHIIPGRTTRESAARIRERQRELRELAGEYGVEIFFGGENFMNNDFLSALNEGWLPVIHNGPYILAEFNVRQDYHTLQFDFDCLYEMSVRQLTPVIAHVERYFHDGLDWDLIDEWFNEGYVFQINATSLLGLDSPQSKKNAWALLKKGYAHIVATDTHRTEGRRIENLSQAYEQVKNRFGQENADLLFVRNPNALIEGTEIEDMEVKPSGGLFSFFKKRG